MTKNTKNSRLLWKIVRLTGLYAVIAFCTWFCILFYLNGTVVFAAPGPSTSVSAAQATPTDNRIHLEGVPWDAQDIAFSYDGEYCTYILGSSLVVREIATGRTVRTIKGDGLSHPVLMADRNILMYFTREESGIVLNTYDIGADRLSNQADFSVSAGAQVKSMDYSNQTNLLYVCFSQDNDGSEKDMVYCVNIMKDVSRTPASGVVDNMVLLGQTDELCYNGPDGTLYAKDRLFKSLQKGKIIGRDAQDRIYVQSPDNGGTVYVCEMGREPQQITLDGGAPLRFYTDQKNVYALYAASLVNVSGQKRKTDFDSSLQFLGMGGDAAYFREADGSIAGMKTTID
jgi:hypothetical protein